MKNYNELKADIEQIYNALSDADKAKINIFATSQYAGDVTIKSNKLPEFFVDKWKEDWVDSVQIKTRESYCEISDENREQAQTLLLEIKYKLDKLGYSVSNDTCRLGLEFNGKVVFEDWELGSFVVEKNQLYIEVWNENVVDTNDIPFVRN